MGDEQRHRVTVWSLPALDRLYDRLLTGRWVARSCPAAAGSRRLAYHIRPDSAHSFWDEFTAAGQPALDECTRFRRPSHGILARILKFRGRVVAVFFFCLICILLVTGGDPILRSPVAWHSRFPIVAGCLRVLMVRRSSYTLWLSPFPRKSCPPALSSARASTSRRSLEVFDKNNCLLLRRQQQRHFLVLRPDRRNSRRQHRLAHRRGVVRPFDGKCRLCHSSSWCGD